ncbi:MAG: hypothetical protein D6761_01845 [Candidatus Dadabacteria bacterium]|nr:MAG: hypothetical protein D6761_01845 [Candidatus Dadabacteria bacterium]
MRCLQLIVVVLLVCPALPANAQPTFARTPASEFERRIATIGGVDALNPMAPDPARYRVLKRLIEKPDDALAAVDRLWLEYRATHRPVYADWALQYGLLWWQSLPDGADRAEAAALLQKLAAQLSREQPDHPAGPFWFAMFYGLEGLARGVLNALHMLPTFKDLLDRASTVSRDYFFGAIQTIQAKMYIKLPPFPVSYGDIDKGLALLEAGRLQQESVISLWHITRAEALYLKEGPEAALVALEGIQKICPRDLLTAYNYEVGMFLAERFREAIANHTYNRYTWDPLLASVQPLHARDWPIPKHCKVPSSQ